VLPVAPPKVVPFTEIDTLGMLSPSSAEVTLPVISLVCARSIFKPIAKKLNTEFYFAHPYSSWERGLNEYTNKLIRQYIIKGSNFDLYDSEYIKLVQNKINRRPRKT